MYSVLLAKAMLNASIKVPSTSPRAEKQSICSSAGKLSIGDLATLSMIVLASRSEVRMSFHRGQQIAGRQWFVFAWKKPCLSFGLLELHIQDTILSRREDGQVARQLLHYPEGQ